MCGFSCCVVVIALSVRLAVPQRVAGAEKLSCARTIDLQLNWQWSASAAAGLGAYVPAAEEPYSPYTAPAVENNDCTAHHNNASRTNVAIFWTVGPGPMAKGVVQELYAALNTSGLLRAARSIVINSRDWQVAATESSASAPETEKPMVRWRELLPAHAWLPRTVLELSEDAIASRMQLGVSQAEARKLPFFEFPTLQALGEYCQHNPTHLALYMHSKGSTFRTQKSGWRGNLVRFTIHRHRKCTRHLVCDGYSACGPNLELRRAPRRAGGLGWGSWLHYSGNFWRARCDYIRQLPPLRVNKRDLTNGSPGGPSGRYLAEWWIGSGGTHGNRSRGLISQAALPIRFKSCWGQPEAFLDGHGQSSRKCRYCSDLTGCRK